MQYFFANGNEQRGPYSLEQLAALGLRPDTLVWHEGMSAWQRADALPEVMALIPIAQPAPVAAPIAAPGAPAVAQQPYAPAPLSALSYESPLSLPPASGQAVASLVLGIVAVLSMCGVHVGGIIGIPCSILAVVFGHIGKAKARRQEAGGAGMALAGLICGYIYLSLVIFVLLAVIVFATAVAFKR